MNHLGVDNGSMVEITNIILSPATFINLQPQSTDFLEIYDPKAVLEKSLRSYSAVTQGENILIRYNDKNYLLKVLEIQPLDYKNAVSIIEADVNVEFAPPVGYVEPPSPPAPKRKSQSIQTEDTPDLDPSQVVESDEEDNPKPNEFIPFTGKGAKISGKPLSSSGIISLQPAEEKKPYLIKGQLQYLTPTQLNAIKQQEPRPQKPPTVPKGPTPSQKPSTTDQKGPTSAQKPSIEAKATIPAQKPTITDQKGPTSAGQASAQGEKPTEQKFFTGKGYSLK